MAISEKSGGTQRASFSGGAQATSAQLAFPAAVTAGSLLVAMGSVFNANITINAPTDTRGTTYTILFDNTATNHNRFIIYGIAPSSGANTITLNFSANCYISFSIDEFIADGAIQFDVEGTRGTGTSTAPSSSITTTTAGALILGLVSPNVSSGAHVLTPAQTQIGEEENANNFETYNASFQIAGAAGAYTQSWTIGASQSWDTMSAAFKEAASSTALSGAGNSLATSTGAISSTKGISGAGNTLGTASGTLTTGAETALTANAKGEALSTGSFVTTLPVTGAATAIATSGGSVLSLLDTLGATVLAEAKADGTLGLTINIAGNALGEALTTATIGIPNDLLGQSTGESTATGAIQTEQTLQSIATALSQSTGFLNAIQPFTTGQSGVSKTTSSQSVTTIPVNTFQGSTFLLGVLTEQANTINAPTDNAGNSYTSLGVATTYSGSTAKLQLWACINGNGRTGHTFSETVTGSGNKTTLFFLEIIGAAASLSLEGYNQVLDSASPFTVTSGTPSRPDNLFVSIVGSQAGSGGGGGNSITAASASLADVQAAINSAGDGWTVNVPAGSATWAASLVIPSTKGIILKGAGKTQTIITVGALIEVNCNPSVAPIRITGFRFNRLASYVSGGYGSPLMRFLNATSKPHWRLDNNIFDEGGASAEYTVEVGQKGNENLDSYNYGVIDHNEIIGLNLSTFFHVNWVRWGAVQEDQIASGDFQWRQTLVRGSDRAVYIEDNIFTKQSSTSAAPQVADTQYGGMVVVRYNTIQSPWMSTHSGCTNGGRHTPWHEIYKNTFVVNGTGYGGNNIELRSTSGVVWGNTQAGGAFSIAVDHERSYRTDCLGGAYGQTADGTRAYDQNVAGQAGWRAFGQPGWGPPQNTNMSGTGLNAYTFSGVFAIDNRAGGVLQTLFIQNNNGNTPTHLQFGRELFNEANVTIGTLAARPATCTPGDAFNAGRSIYVSTDENPRGNTGGIVIYACLATNVWTKHYEPFTYPHPLTITLGDSGSSNAAHVESTGFTVLQDEPNSALGLTGALAVKPGTSTAQLTPSWTRSSSTDMAVAVVSVKKQASDILLQGQASAESLSNASLQTQSLVSAIAIANAETSSSITSVNGITAAGNSISRANTSMDTVLDIAGTGEANATTSADISQGINLSGDAVAESLITANPTTLQDIISAATAIGESAGTLNITIAMDATALQEAFASGALSVDGAVNLSGSAISEASIAGSPTVSISTTAIGLSSSDALGNLTVSSDMQGASQAINIAEGNIITVAPLDSIATSIARADGSLIVSLGIDLSANGVAEALSSGNLVISTPLDTSTLLGSMATAAGILTSEQALSGTSAASGLATVYLTITASALVTIQIPERTTTTVLLDRGDFE